MNSLSRCPYILTFASIITININIHKTTMRCQGHRQSLAIKHRQGSMKPVSTYQNSVGLASKGCFKLQSSGVAADCRGSRLLMAVGSWHHDLPSFCEVCDPNGIAQDCEHGQILKATRVKQLNLSLRRRLYKNSTPFSLQSCWIL